MQPIPDPQDIDDLFLFKNIHRGERCFVIGNGPSLNKTDLSLLKYEYTFGCNGIFLLFDKIEWRPSYYTCVDSRVLPDRAPEINRMLSTYPDMVSFFPHYTHEHHGEHKITLTRDIITKSRNCFFFQERYISFEGAPESTFSTDINQYVIMPYTVAITMLQIAAYMGFSEIYLIGCDTSYKVKEEVIREGRKDNGEEGIALTSVDDNDPNHFDPTYFGKGRKWHDPQVDMMKEHHRQARIMLERLGIRVFNATVGGKLEVYERKDYQSLFQPATGA